MVSVCVIIVPWVESSRLLPGAAGATGLRDSFRARRDGSEREGRFPCEGLCLPSWAVEVSLSSYNEVTW